jgi:CheY-like chemotaxis protein
LLQGLKILVAEDNELNQKIAGFILLKQSATFDAAMNGREAVERLQKNNYDLILMDVHMPEMDGFEATDYIRKTMKNNIPIIGVTASYWQEEFDACMKVGMNTCITKPLFPDTLCKLILKVIEESKLTS